MTSNIIAFKNYLELEKKYSSHTIKAYIEDLYFFQKFNQTTFNKTTIDKVSYSQIRNWIIYLVENNNTNNSINRKVGSLKAYYKFLLKTKQITTSPLLKHKSLKTQRILQIPFSEKEIKEVLNSEPKKDFDNFESIRNKLILELFYTSGIRRAELINLKNSDINILNQSMKVVGKRSKERILPLLSKTILKMAEYQEERNKIINTNTDYFFITKKGIKLSESFVYRIIKLYFSTISEKTKKSPHILRHTFATHLLNNGADLNSVKELLGHSSLASTQIYTNSSLAELKKIYQETHPRNKK